MNEIRSLGEQIDYMRQNGYQHDGVTLQTLYLWYGEQVALQREINSLCLEKTKVANLVKVLKLIRDQPQGGGGTATDEECWKQAYCITVKALETFDK